MSGQEKFGIALGFFLIALCAGVVIYFLRSSIRKEKPKEDKKQPFMKKVVSVLNRITEIFNIIAVAALVCMLLLVCANVIMRYIFNNPIPGTYELTQALMICLTPCIAVNIMAKQCVWVDVVTAKFNRLGQLIIDIITLPLSVSIIGVMAWQGFNMILSSYEKGTYSSVMSFRLMEWPFRLVYFLAMLMATLAAIAFTIERFEQYKNGGTPVDKNEVDRAIEEVGDLSVPEKVVETGFTAKSPVHGCGGGCGHVPMPARNETKGDAE